MEHRQLEYFVTLVDEGSFVRAAARLFISQPALSQQIQRLEERVGVELIDRSVRPFAMTAVGERIYIEARKILDTVQAIDQISGDAHNGQIGRIRLGIAPSLLFGPLPALLNSFQRQYQGVNLILERRTTQQLRLELGQQRLDAVLLFAPAEIPNTKSHTLYRLPFVAALPRDHPLAAEPSVRFAELRGETFITVPHGHAPENHDAIVTGCMNAGFSPNMLSVQGTYLEHVGFVAAGYGISIVPEFTTRFTTSDVVFRALSDPAMSFDITVSWRDAPNPVIDNLVEHLSTDLARRGFAHAQPRLASTERAEKHAK